MNNLFNKIVGTNLVNGKFLKFSKETLTITNPSTLKEIGNIPLPDREEIINTIEIANKAFNTWSQTKAETRKILLDKWQELILTNIDALAEILTLEQGKPIEDSKKEIIYGANFIGWFASQAISLSGHIRKGTKENQKILIEYEPVGVIAAITPWNFPSAMVSRKIAPALAAGCTIILKPSELTPFSALALGYLAHEAGIPEGVINIITPQADLFSDILQESKIVRKISFTGSTRVGKILFKKSAQTIKKLSLELGGNSPVIICEDANIEKTVSSILAGKLRSTGQACTSPNRILVHKNIYDNIISKLEEEFRKITIGNGFNPKVNLGPLINSASIAKIDRLIKDAISKGAGLVYGGKKSEFYFDENNILQKSSDNHTFYMPTIIKNCTSDMEIFKEEIFGPVLAFYKFSTIDEAIELANNSDYGLASYIFTTNHELSWQISDKLDYGIVGINEALISNEIGAFGGRKESGFGIEGSIKGIYEFLNTKYKCINYS